MRQLGNLEGMFYSGDWKWSLESATRTQAPPPRSNLGLENKRKQFSYPREETASAVLSPELLHWCRVSSGQPWTHLYLHEGLVSVFKRVPGRRLPRGRGKHGSGTHVCPDPFPATGTQHIQPGLMQVQSTPSEQLPVPRPHYPSPQPCQLPCSFLRWQALHWRLGESDPNSTSSLLPTRCSSCFCSSPILTFGPALGPQPLSVVYRMPYLLGHGPNTVISGSNPSPAWPPLSREFIMWGLWRQALLRASGHIPTDDLARVLGGCSRGIATGLSGHWGPSPAAGCDITSPPEQAASKKTVTQTLSNWEDQESGMFSPLCFSSFRKVDNSNLEGWREPYQLKRTQGNLSCFAGALLCFLCCHPDSPQLRSLPFPVNSRL